MMRLFIFLSMGLMHSVFLQGEKNEMWTHEHRVTFTDALRSSHAQKKSLLITDCAVSPFTQLIFSWNAVRPLRGYFSFYAQVRDTATKKWGPWHKMVDWGNSIQRSYVSKGNGFSSYAHVRLEIEGKKTADAFRVKIESKDTATLDCVHSLCVATSHFGLFAPEPVDSILHKIKTVHIPNIPSIAQFAIEHPEKHRICSPVSCMMVAQYLTGNTYDVHEFVKGVFDTGLSVYGSWACNMAHLFDVCKNSAYFYVKRCNSFVDIYKQLERGIPCIVSVRGTLPGAMKPFPSGHLMVVVGCDISSKEVVCHDPAAEQTSQVLKRYPLAAFLSAWERSHRLTYAVDSLIIPAQRKS